MKEELGNEKKRRTEEKLENEKRAKGKKKYLENEMMNCGGVKDLDNEERMEGKNSVRMKGRVKE
jgi:hypothetical protein